ncbi:alpha/beta hydrolase [Pseudomonas sp. N040]|uniref:alpha/beta hydrolase n=1 Tax=Pseudomonas sp. N040 TaxID=2785325 RepID=UPI0018A2A225|nr:alpha/beta hydrolase [Pseudomonas sp. N040]MBF7730095.1 hypothetical protein [Pseudomonas sp. N040]MBW7013737.1 lysophospholipase [Pseudomonas sp. N040]
MFDWTGEDSVRDGVRCRTFRPQSEGGLASAALFDRPQAAADSRAPIILMQHGGSTCKTGLDIWDVATELVGRQGLRLIALDGPVHGARAVGIDPGDGALVRARFFELWGSDPGHVLPYVQRWQALLDEIQEALNGVPCMWLGLSMGTAYGLPLLAIDKRIARAVVGMWGTSFVNSRRLVSDAAAVSCPVLFQQKWDDELFSREGQLELFDALGTADKRLHVYPGGHVRLGTEQLQDIARFLHADQLQS